MDIPGLILCRFPAERFRPLFECGLPVSSFLNHGDQYTELLPASHPHNRHHRFDLGGLVAAIGEILIGEAMGAFRARLDVLRKDSGLNELFPGDGLEIDEDPPLLFFYHLRMLREALAAVRMDLEVALPDGGADADKKVRGVSAQGFELPHGRRHHAHCEAVPARVEDADRAAPG